MLQILKKFNLQQIVFFLISLIYNKNLDINVQVNTGFMLAAAGCCQSLSKVILTGCCSTLYIIYHASLGAKPFLIRNNGLTYCCVSQFLESENALLFFFILSHFCDARYVIIKHALMLFTSQISAWARMRLKRKRFLSKLGYRYNIKKI